MRDACGVVTVNSTSGLRALQLGRPVQVLGQAVYDVPGLTHASCLHAFWAEPPQPNYALLDAFIRLLVARTQLRGVFFHPEGKRVAVAGVVDRLNALVPISRGGRFWKKLVFCKGRAMKYHRPGADTICPPCLRVFQARLCGMACGHVTIIRFGTQQIRKTWLEAALPSHIQEIRLRIPPRAAA